MDTHKKVKNDIKDIGKDIYQEATAKTTEAYSNVKDRSESIAQNVKRTSQDFVEENLTKTRQIVGDYTEELTKHVQDKPLSSLLIAGGIGYFLAFLLKK